MKRALLILVLVLAVVLLAGERWLRAIPEVRVFAPPGRSRWQPGGPRVAGAGHGSVIPLPDTFHAMHVGTTNSDEVWSVVAPLLEYEWTAEPEKYVAEGPTFDNEGNLWGMNYQPQADAVFGVTMDGWVFAHDRRTGTPLLRAPFRLPGAPAVISARPPAWVSSLADHETDAAFGRPRMVSGCSPRSTTSSSAAASTSPTSTPSTPTAGVCT